MKSTRAVASVFCLSLLALSCKNRKFTAEIKNDKADFPEAHRPPSKWWKEIYSTRVKDHLNYVKGNSGGTIVPGEGFRWFRDFPVGFIGVPLMLFKALPDLAPEIYGKPDANYGAVGFGLKPPTEWKKNASLPLGLGYTHTDLQLPSVLEDGTKTSFVPPISVVTMSCGACHIGRLRLRSSEENVATDYAGTADVPSAGSRTVFLVGAPNTEFDAQLFRRALERFSESEYLKEENIRATAEKVSKAVLLFQNFDDIFGNTGITIKTLFLKLDMAFEKKFIYGNVDTVETLLRTVKKGALDGRDLINELESFAYNSGGHLKGNRTVGSKEGQGSDYGTPGQFDAFGMASIAFSGSFGSDDAADNKFRAANIGNTPGMADAMSVWRQDLRPYGNWNGNMKDKFYRNLGASAGGAGSPVATDIQNVDIVTKFVEDLPSPPYPYNVEQGLAARGKEIFEANCTQCHGSKVSGWEGDKWAVSEIQFNKVNKMPFWIDVGTDPGRRMIQSPAAALAMVEELKVGCKTRHLRLQLLGNRKLCDKDVSEILAPPQTTQEGYIPPNLSGLWSRAPYLHNGSVPNLRALLTPPEQRPDTFVRGISYYNAVDVGFVSKQTEIEKEFGKLDDLLPEFSGVSVYDTSSPGRSNKGHYNLRVVNINELKESGEKPKIDAQGSWPRDEAGINALVEYLKTL